MSVIYGDLNYESIKFKKYFSSKNVYTCPVMQGTFAARSGKIQNFDDNNILLTTENMGKDLAQDIDNIMVK